MGDFDLSQALDCSLNLDETGCESRCFNVTEEVIRLDEGLDLVVSRDPKTLKSVISLLLAVNRMKQPLTCCYHGLSDVALCSAIMDSLVTETLVPAMESSSSSLKRIFQRFNSDDVVTLCDFSQRDVVLASGDMKLQAITLKGGSGERKVSFKLARYLCPSSSSGDGLAVVLSITSSRHISCSMRDGTAMLNLEECCKQKMQNISHDEDMDRFLFYKRTTGVSLNTFESVKYRGWVISTSNEDANQSVEMCQVDTGHRLTDFRIN